MGTIWMFCGLMVIGGVLANQSSIVPLTSSVSSKIPIKNKSTRALNRDKPQRAISSFDFIIPTSSLVPSSSSLIARVGVNPYKYYEPVGNYNHQATRNQPFTAEFLEKFPILQGADYSKTSLTKPVFPRASHVPTSSSTFSHSSRSTLPNRSHPNTHSKFEGEKFSRLNNRSPIGNHPIATPHSAYSQNFKQVNLPQYQNSEYTDGIQVYNLQPQLSHFSGFNNPGPHAPTNQNYQTIPVYTPTNNYQFPNAKVADNYQLLSAQPQLHFHGNSQPIYHSQPFERIRTDVEVINKKPSPAPPVPHDDDNDDDEDFDVGYKNPSTNPFAEENIVKRQPPAPARLNSFKVPSSSLFNSYDEAFGKFSKHLPEPTIPTKAKIIEKPERYNPNNSDEQPEKHVYEVDTDDLVNSKEKTDQYDGKTESLPRGRQQRDHYDNHGNQQSDHDYGGYDNGPAHYDSYDHDFEHDFEDSYRSEIPQEEFAHIKEVPDFEGSASNERLVTQSRNTDNKSSRNGKIPRQITTTTVVPILKNFGSKFPKEIRRKINSSERTTEINYPRHNSRQTKSIAKAPNQLVTKNREKIESTTTFKAPSGEVKAVSASPYIHRGGLRVVDPPALAGSRL